MDPAELIDALGGSAAVAGYVGVEPNTVGNWRKRGFPAWALPTIAMMCDQRRIDPGNALDPPPPRRISRAA